MHRAIQVEKVGGSEVLKLAKLKIPGPPKEKEVLVEMRCSGVNPVDTMIRAGQFPNPELPFIPHMDGAGIVKQVGSKVSRIKVGQRVFVSQNDRFGTLAEYALIQEKNVFSIGEKMGFAEGAALGIPYMTAYRALYILADGKPGKRVLVHGATGGVGQAAVQLAVGGNMAVTGTAGTETGRDSVLANGASSAYIHREKGYVEKMKAEQGGFDIIIEVLANVNLENDISLLNKKGTIVVIGSRGQATITPMNLFFTEGKVVGCLIFNSSEDEWAETGNAIEVGIKKGIVKPRIHKRYALAEAGKAHDDIISGEPTNGKLVIDVTK